MKNLLFFTIILFSRSLVAAPVGDCEGTPEQAVVSLPAPLSQWAQIVCTPYGHIITNKEGWIWSRPGGYSPVMIPSQMIRDNPKELKNNSYFTEISMVELSGGEADESIKIFEKGFDASEEKPKVYSLEVTSISGKSLVFRFYDYGDSQWGMWCNKSCDPNTSFMLLNMAKRPNN